MSSCLRRSERVRYSGSGVGETESSTMVGCVGVSRQRWEEERVGEPGRVGSEEIRWRKEVRQRGEM